MATRWNIATDPLVNLFYGLRLQRLLKYEDTRIGYILGFHRTLPRPTERLLESNRILEVTAERFEEVIKFFLSSGYKFISLDDLYLRLLTNAKGKKFIVTTFDDGYRDTCEIAFPILERYDIPFAIYVTTSYADNSFLHWRTYVDEYVMKANQIQVPQGSRTTTHRTVNQSEKALACRLISRMIDESPPDSRKELLGRVFHVSCEDLAAYSRAISISWDEVKKISESRLCTIGAHSVTHPRFSRISSDAIRREILQGIEEIESRINVKVQHFAFPYGGIGEITPREIRVAKECRLKTSATTYHGHVSAGSGANLHSLPRVLVSMETNVKRLDLRLRYRFGA